MRNNLKHAIDENLKSLTTTAQERADLLRRCTEGHRVTRRYSLAFLVTLLLVLLAATALAVTALTGHLRFMKPDEGPQAQSCTILDDTLYMLTNEGLTQWTPSNETESILPMRSLRALGISFRSELFHTDTLMLFDTQSHTIWQYQDGSFIKQWDLHSIAAELDARYVANVVAQNGYLFFRAVGDGNSEPGTLLWRVNLATGQADTLPIPDIAELCAYRDDQLLAIQHSFAAETDALVVLDVQSGAIVQEITSLPIIQLRGIAYSRANDTILALYNGTLSRWSDTQWVPLQTVSVPPMSFYFGTISGGYVAADYTGVQFISLEAEEEKPTLVIRGWRNPHSVEDDFIQANPDVQLKRENQPRFNGEIIHEALDKGDEVDIFYVRLDANVIQLMLDGRLAPLSSYPTLAEDIGGMLPAIQSAVSPAGTACALPASLMIPLWMMRRDADMEAPATIMDLLAQNCRWSENPEEKAIYLANDNNAIAWTKQDYARYALMQAWDEATAAGTRPDFASEPFTAFLTALKDAKLSAVSYPDDRTVVVANSFYMLRGRTGDEAYLKRKVINPPAVTAVQTDIIPSWLLIYAVNANSKNPALAREFLAYVAQQRNAGDQAMLSPFTAEPSVYPYAQVPGFEGLQALPDSWEVAESELALYQTEIVPKLWISRYPYMKDQAIMLDTIAAYLSGDITLAQCTDQLNALASAAAEN